MVAPIGKATGVRIMTVSSDMLIVYVEVLMPRKIETWIAN